MNLIDFDRIGRGLTDLWDGISNCRWPETFFKDALDMTDKGLLDAVPTLLFLYVMIYAVFLVSALTLRLVQAQKSIFAWKEKIPIFVLSLLVFPVWPVFLNVIQQMGQIAASVEGHFALSLSGLYYLFDLITAIWVPLVLMIVLAALLVYPLNKALKCFTSYKEKPLVGAIWTVFDVGLGLFCACAFLLGMYIGKWQLYLLAPMAIILNHFGEKKQGDPPKKKTAEIYSTSP